MQIEEPEPEVKTEPETPAPETAKQEASKFPGLFEADDEKVYIFSSPILLFNFFSFSHYLDLIYVHFQLDYVNIYSK